MIHLDILSDSKINLILSLVNQDNESVRLTWTQNYSYEVMIKTIIKEVDL